MRAGGKVETGHKVETKGLQAKVACKLANLESESPCFMERNTGTRQHPRSVRPGSPICSCPIDYP